jgi:hypothetical protein
MSTIDTLTSVYSSHALYLERVAAKLGNDVLPYLESIEERIGVVLNAMPNRMLSTQELNAVRSEISKITSEELQAYTTQYKLDNKELGEHEVAFHARTLDSVTDGYESSIPSLGVLNSVVIGAPIKVGENQFTTYGRYVSSYWQQYTKVIDDSVAAGFIQGGTNREIAARIRDAITLDSPDGDLSKAMRAAKTMARTGTNHYATQATVAFVDANDRVLTGYRFLATLDNRTSRQCFVGETEITHFTGVERLYRSDYSGEIFTVTLSTGEKLIGTPNHPILTQHGWTTIDKLNPSEHVCYSTVDNVGQVLAVDDVRMKTTIGELFDSVSKSSSVDVVSESATAADFNGDGLGMNGKVDVVSPKCHLRGNTVSGLGKSIVNNLFSFVHGAVNLLGNGYRFPAIFGKLKSVKASKVFSCFPEKSVKSCFSNASFNDYIARPNAFIKKLNSLVLRLYGFAALPSSCSVLHDSHSLEQVCDGSGAGVIPLGNLPSGESVFVKQCDIVSITSEFKSCHVYTLQCDQGYYIASGAIVKNCSALDQQVFSKNDKNIPFPPIHQNCRSRVIVEIDGRFSFDDSASTRPSNFTDADGDRDPKRVSSKKTYHESLKAMSEEDRIAILGSSLGKALTKMDADTFAKSLIDSTFEPLTISEMKKRDNELGRILKAMDRG